MELMDKLKPFLKSDILEAGVDEVGRGCLAGPVVASAVILPNNFDFDIVKDSKQLSENKRIEAVKIIKENALYWAVYSVNSKRVDEINILQATYEAMHGALNKMEVNSGIKVEHILVDGDKFNGYKGVLHTCVVKGDATYYSIAAASILAKVARDEYMKYLSSNTPVYDWANNKGYGSKKHRAAIVEHGVTEYHRMSFLGNILPKNTNNLF
jgi:ribonuclease HII